MGAFKFLAFFSILLKLYIGVASGKCPSELPLEINSRCYRLYTDLSKYKDAKDNCRNLDANSRIVSSMKSVPHRLSNEIKDFIGSKLEKAYVWIGFKMEDKGMKDLDDRKWTFDYDDTKVIQKNYDVWADRPTESGLTCAVLNGSRDFNVLASDCGGPRLPVVCMRKGDNCQDDIKPFFRYGDHCLAAITGALEYNKIAGACHPDTPTPVKDHDMKKYVVNAVKNSFLGGAVFMGIKKVEGNYLYLGGRPVPDEMWGEGEPRNGYDCAGLALQVNGSVRLRTLSCDFLAASLCYIAGGGTELVLLPEATENLSPTLTVKGTKSIMLPE